MIFFNMTPKVINMTKTKCDYIRLQGCTENRSTELQKIFTNHISGNGLISIKHKELNMTNSKKGNFKMAKESSQTDFQRRHENRQLFYEKQCYHQPSGKSKSKPQ